MLIISNNNFNFIHKPKNYSENLMIEVIGKNLSYDISVYDSLNCNIQANESIVTSTYEGEEIKFQLIVQRFDYYTIRKFYICHDDWAKEIEVVRVIKK
jgi:hypothetical protein